jgi:pimeloyl-ACP methyl ester carboxylesterase
MSGTAQTYASGHVDAAGNRIHYVEGGSGSPLLLVHGAFSRGAEFLTTDFGAYLAPRYRIIAPDSLGHGASGAPPETAHYGARRRASHLVAVLDALGIERAHVVGYSMGGWMASALATFHPERVASLAIGGWDVVKGMYTPAAVWGLPEITGQILIEMARAEHPELAEWVRPEDESALSAAIEGMNDLAGLAEGVARCGAPVALWCGREDLYYDAVVAFAEANGFPVLSLPGDHNTMLYEHGAEAAEHVSRFIEANAR